MSKFRILVELRVVGFFSKRKGATFHKNLQCWLYSPIPF